MREMSISQLNYDRTLLFNFAEFDLETLRSSLDEKGLAIAESQETSMKSRKQLSEKTKGTITLRVPSTFNRRYCPLLSLNFSSFLCRI